MFDFECEIFDPFFLNDYFQIPQERQIEAVHYGTRHHWRQSVAFRKRHSVHHVPPQVISNSFYSKLICRCGHMEGIPAAWGYVEGGMGKISEYFKQAADEKGVIVRTGQEVQKIFPGKVPFHSFRLFIVVLFPVIT